MNPAVHNQMAQFAYTHVHDALTQSIKPSEFRSLARSFPSMLQANGLCASIAFLYAKSKDNGPHQQLYMLIDKWIQTNLTAPEAKKEALAQRITHLNSSEYRLYTTAVMNLCLWVKRYAEGMVEADGKEQNR